MPAAPPAARRHNLPAETTSFVGRADALAALKRLLTTSRLVTITGPGGSGKTRLALRLAAEVVDRYRDGVWLVELAAVTDPGLVPQAVASVLGVQAEPPDAPAALALALATKRLLLVLDNCEHLPAACAALVERLLRECGSVQVLATSRESLRAAGEVTWSLPPLELADRARHDLAALQQNEAVRLFVERARARQPDFALTAHNAAAVAVVCERVDGIPLAIELAAALVASFSVEELAGLLEHALPVLVRGSRSAARQTTLRDTIDWSYALLSEAERRLFRRLAVFHGGWSLEAAIAVGAEAATDGSGYPRGNVPALLASLVDKSVVTADNVDGAARYRLLEPVRQYAAELLENSGEQTAVQHRHARYFTLRAEALAPALASAGRDPALDALTLEQQNLRAALRWALDDDAEPVAERADLGLRLSGALFWYFHFRGSGAEALRWLEPALAKIGYRADAVAAWALYAAGDTALLLGKNDLSRPWLQRSVALWRALGDQRGLAYALQALCCALEEGSPDRWPAAHEGVALMRQAGDSWGAALAGFSRGFVAQQDGDRAATRAYMAQGVAEFQALGDHWFVAQILNHLGDMEREEDRIDRAASLYAQALSELERCAYPSNLPSVLYNLGVVALRRGQLPRARGYVEQALALFRDRGDQRGIAECLVALGRVALSLRQPERAARLFGAAEALLTRAGAELWMSNRAAFERDRALAHAGLGAEAFARAWTIGHTLSPVEMLAEALPEREPAGTAAQRSSPRVDELTPREREVATLVAQGKSNREIAAALVISTGTAGLHVKHILHKLGCRSRAQVAALVAAGMPPA